MQEWLVSATAEILGPLLTVTGGAAAPHGSPAALGLVGVSPAMVQLRADIPRAAASPFPVLIEGESGVGKELVARADPRRQPAARARLSPSTARRWPRS